MSYGIVHRGIFESSVAECWEACVTFIALLALADAEDNVYSDIGRLRRITNFPESVLRKGIEKLMEPDRDSRSQEEEGARIVYLPLVGTDQEPSMDECRGWHIVNRSRYKRATRRVYQRQYMQVYRAAKKYSDPGAHNPEDAKVALEEFRK